MITFMSVILIIIWALLVPFLAGMCLELIRGEGKYISVAGCIAYGFAIMCAVFQLLSVEMILLHTPFHVLKNIWIVIMLVISFAGMWLYYAKYIKGKDNKTKTRPEIGIIKSVNIIKKDKFTLAIWIFALLVIAFETYLLTFKMHIDTDDARFLAEALEAYEKDTMLLYHPITGYFYDIQVGEQLKDITAPYPIFLGLIGKIFYLHPTIAAHTILPLLYIPLCYGVYSLVGSYFFGEDEKKKGLFLLFLAFIHLFSFETIYSSGYTLLTIIWQGRSVVAMIMLPLLWYQLLVMTGKDSICGKDYLNLLVVMFANAMLSNMGAVFSMAMLLAYTAVVFFNKRSFKTLVFMGLCLLPNMIYMIGDKILFSGILYR